MNVAPAMPAPDLTEMLSLAILKPRTLPYWLYDATVLSQLKEMNAALYRLTPETVEGAHDDELEKLEDILELHLDTIERYTAVRRQGWFHIVSPARLAQETSRGREAVYALSRGYAPGHLPSRAQREQRALAQLSNREITSR
jgi:hypothetical protein